MLTVIDTKIHILRDFGILPRNGTSKREKMVWAILLQYDSETAIDIAVHDLVLGRISIDQWIENHKVVLSA